MPRRLPIGKRMRREQGSILPLAGLRGIAVTGRQQGQLGMDNADSKTSRDRTAICFPPNAVHLVRTNQPSPGQLAYWRKRGIKTVINLRGQRDEA